MNSRIGLLVALVSTASYPNVVLTFGSDKEAQVPHALTPSAFEIGGSLVANCRHGEPQTHYCIGYVVGIIDMAKLLYLSSGDEGMRFCLDGSLTLAQNRDRRSRGSSVSRPRSYDRIHVEQAEFSERVDIGAVGILGIAVERGFARHCRGRRDADA